jgi:hypothetical protein
MGRAQDGRPVAAMLSSGVALFAATACAQLHEKADAGTRFESVAAPSGGTPVRVLDEQKRAVAGAFVTWFEELPEDSRELAPEPQLGALRRKFGKTVVTNADGETRVGRYACLVASAGTSYAATKLQRQHVVVTLVLRPSRSITIVTVDAQQRPVAEVPIVVGSDLRPNDFEFEWRASTDAAGVATFAPIDLLTPAGLDKERRLQVSVDAPLRVARNRRLAGNALPAEPIRFEMPPTGRLVLDAVEPDGLPIERIQSTTLRLKGDRSSIAWEAWDGRSHHELPHVETGMEFDAEIENRQGQLETMQSVTGPRAPAESVTARLVGRNYPRVSARLVDEAGAPVADREVEWFVTYEGRRPDRMRMGSSRTDGDGRASIRYTLVAVWWPPWSSLRCWITVAERDDRKNRVEATGTVEIAIPTDDRSNAPFHRDVGEVRVARSQLVASGIVVDDAGAPVSGVRIGVKIDLTGLVGEHGIPIVGGFADPLLWTTSGRDGAFEVFGDDHQAPHFLTASRGSAGPDYEFGHVEHPSFPQGTRDLRITLPRLGTLAGRVVCPSGEMQDVQLRLSGIDRRGDPVQWRSERVAVDGSFECFLPSGSWTLRIKPAGEGVGPSAKFELAPGTVVTLPPIDLHAPAEESEVPHAR